MLRLDRAYDLPEFPYGDVVGSQLAKIDSMIARGAPAGEAIRLKPGNTFDRLRTYNEAGLPGLRARLPHGVGEGVWDFFKLSDTVYLSLTDATYDGEMRVQLPFENVVKLRFLLSGELRLLFFGQRAQCGPGIYVSVHPSRHENSYEIVHGRHQQMAVLHCQSDFFAELLGRYYGRATPLDDTAWQARGASLAPISAGFVHEVAQLFDPPCFGPIAGLFRETRCAELLMATLQMVGGGSAAGADGGRRGPGRRDLDRVYEARALLLANLDNPPSISTLARAVGTNQTSLKKDFRDVVGAPIFEFVQGERLRQALELLRETDLAITEIAYRVGYRHPGNFATAFKRRYRTSPRAFRRGTQR